MPLFEIFTLFSRKVLDLDEKKVLPSTSDTFQPAERSKKSSVYKMKTVFVCNNYCAKKKKQTFHLGRGTKNFSSFAEHLFGNPEIPLTAFFPVLPPSLPLLLPSSPLLPPFLMLLKFSPDSLPHLGGISLQNRIIIIITSSLAFSSSSHCLRCSSSLLQILDTPFSSTTFCALYNF